LIPHHAKASPLPTAFFFTVLTQWYKPGCQTSAGKRARKYLHMLLSGKSCHLFRHSPLIVSLTLVKLGVRKEKDALHSGKRPAFRKSEKERMNMSNSNNNRINVPQAKEAMNQFKMQAAQEVGVNLTNGYNGHLTSREAGSVGGQMVKKMIEAYEQGMQ
jgi:hypothetical protein